MLKKKEKKKNLLLIKTERDPNRLEQQVKHKKMTLNNISNGIIYIWVQNKKMVYKQTTS